MHFSQQLWGSGSWATSSPFGELSKALAVSLPSESVGGNGRNADWATKDVWSEFGHLMSSLTSKVLETPSLQSRSAQILHKSYRSFMVPNDTMSYRSLATRHQILKLESCKMVLSTHGEQCQKFPDPNCLGVGWLLLALRTTFPGLRWSVKSIRIQGFLSFLY